MTKKIQGNRGGTLYAYEKGESGNPHGRPRKWISNLKNAGYKVSEINDAIQNMLSMNIDELRDVSNNEKNTILEITVASALRKSLEKGSLDAIETLLSRVYGKPAQQVIHSGGEEPVKQVFKIGDREFEF